MVMNNESISKWYNFSFYFYMSKQMHIFTRKQLLLLKTISLLKIFLEINIKMSDQKGVLHTMSHCRYTLFSTDFSFFWDLSGAGGDGRWCGGEPPDLEKSKSTSWTWESKLKSDNIELMLGVRSWNICHSYSLQITAPSLSDLSHLRLLRGNWYSWKWSTPEL